MIYTYVLSNGEVLVPCEFTALTALSLGSRQGPRPGGRRGLRYCTMMLLGLALPPLRGDV